MYSACCCRCRRRCRRRRCCFCCSACCYTAVVAAAAASCCCCSSSCAGRQFCCCWLSEYDSSNFLSVHSNTIYFFMHPLAVLSHFRPRFAYNTSSVITGMRGAKAGVSPPRRNPLVLLYVSFFCGRICLFRSSHAVPV